MDSQNSLSILIDQPLNLANTLESGQAFRWRLQNGWYWGVVQGNLVALRQDGRSLEVRGSSLSSEQIGSLVKQYLRLDDDLEAVYARIDTDAHMHSAIEEYRGLRILRQEPWECLVSFICSANSNIPRISASMESMAQRYGMELMLDGHAGHAFPTPERVAEAGERALRDLGLGFRARYVAWAAERIALREVELESLRHLPYQEARDVLISLPGVGPKVADCVLLFSLDKLEAFPIDRWVERAVGAWYLDNAKLNYKGVRAWALERWDGYAGYAQQYLFYAMRSRGKG